jgi:3-oxoadipate enol-lactonase / 4-carboxymuconolactone decarboxylase
MLCNSLGTTASMWEAQMPRLLDRFCVVRWELPGHGGAPVDTEVDLPILGEALLALLDQLGAARASLCGVSLGGMVAMWLASHHPDRVDRLVLASTAPYLPAATEWLEQAALVRQSDSVGVLAPILLERWFAPAYLTTHGEVAERVGTELDALNPEGYARCCELMAGMDQRADLVRIKAPTLVIAGANDPVTTPSIAFELHQAISGSSLAVLPKAAHLINLEQPDLFGDLVLRHLTGLDATRGQAVRAEVMGSDHVARTAAAARSFSRPFYDLVTRYAWGDVWSRPGLDRGRRSCITLAMLVALGRFDELPMHLRAARRNGLSTDEITEVLLQTAIYCGLPAANSAFKVAEDVLGERPDP